VEINRTAVIVAMRGIHKLSGAGGGIYTFRA